MRIGNVTPLLVSAWALLGSVSARALDLPRWTPELPGWGVQAGLATPLGSDLGTTVGPALNLTLGGFREWTLAPGQVLRSRLDLAWYGTGSQTAEGGGLHQELRTRVKSESLGADYLVPLAWRDGRWTVAPGLALVRWTVSSTNRLERSTGRFVPSGSSSWTRQALSLAGTYRWDRQVEAELRLVASHYGYDNLPTRSATFTLLWHF